MSNLFKKPSSPKLSAPEPIEEVEQVKEDQTQAAKNERRRRIGTGRQSTIISGLRQALKQRLGE